MFTANVMDQLAYKSSKLFNEFYFDFIIAIPINLIALHNYNKRNEFEKLFEGVGNVMNTLFVFIYSVIIFVFAFYQHYLMHCNF